MGTLDRVERKALFRFARLLALGLILLLSIVLIAATAEFVATWKSGSSNVEPEEVLDSLKRTNGGTAQENAAAAQPKGRESDILPGIRVPFNLQDYFSDPANRNVLLAHIDRYTTDEQQEYVNNLSAVVQNAQDQRVNVIDAINAFFRIKDKKMQDAQISRAAQQTKQLYDAGLAASALGLIGVFSLVLVLLAIERNTRLPQAAQKSSAERS